MKVLLTDADYKHTLAAVRSLGRRGVHTVVGCSSTKAQSFLSKYCGERFVYPNPRDENEFVEAIVNRIKKADIDVVLPIGYLASKALAHHAEEIREYSKMAIAPRESFDIAAHKDQTIEFASRLGIETPAQYATAKDVSKFPVVVKWTRESGHMKYVNSKSELTSMELSQSIIQEYVPGDGYGLFALLHEGEPRAVFMHRRIREYPITGGASTSAESIYDEELKHAGLKLLQSLRWHGVAMVEFKKDSRDGKYKLMEINPKFWGSLDLPVSCGIDFPYLTAKMAYDGDIDPVFEYRTGVRFSWIFPEEVMYLLTYPESASQSRWICLDRTVRTNVQIDDPLPTLYQIRMTFFEIAQKLRNKRPRYPQGRPYPGSRRVPLS